METIWKQEKTKDASIKDFLVFPKQKLWKDTK
jgi:hypothetical protein